MRGNLSAMQRANARSAAALNAANAAVRARFGPRLVEARQRAGLTAARLAPALNVTPHTVWLWERGKRSPHLSQLVRLAESLGVTVDWLLGRDPPPAN